ncbi:MAG: murein biosynthesis integral membrane protein MurJ [Patescibacteria group bacterium]|jgi:putative peptidoglycan lipid II flippase
MIKKLFTSKTSGVTSAAIIIGGFSMLSRFVGVWRDNILSSMFGAGDVLDAYTSAFLIPDMLLQLLILGALSASFIPIFSKYYGKNDDQAWKYTSTMLNVFGLGFAGIAILAIIFAPWMTTLVAPGYGAEKLAVTVSMSRVIFLGELFFAASMVFGSVLQGTKRFFLYALAPIVNNIGIILGAIFFVPFLGPIGLAWGAVLGATMHAALQGAGVYALGYRHTFRIPWNDPDLKTTSIQMIPRVLGLAVNQVNFVAMSAIASLSVSGSATVLRFAYNLNSFPIGIIAMAYAVASFPVLCERRVAKDMKGFVTAFSHAIRQVLLWIVPATVMFLLLRAQLVRLAFGRGKFDWAATIMTADTLAFFALSFAAQSFVYIIVRAFFAIEDTKTPFFAGAFAAVVNIALGYTLAPMYGVAGLGMAFSFSAILQVAILWAVLRHRIGALDEGRILRTAALLTVAGSLAGLATQGMKFVVVRYISLDTFVGVFVQTLVAGGIGMLVYFGVGFLLQNEEVRSFTSALHRRVLQQVKPQEVVSQDI